MEGLIPLHLSRYPEPPFNGRLGPAVDISWQTEDPALSEGRVQEIVGAALAHGGRVGCDLSVVFVDEATLSALHDRYLGDPSATDVISFDLGEEGGGPVGELYVSVDRARDVAAERGGSLEDELALYLVHGVLHLCGFDDHGDEERARMRAAEAHVLKGLGLRPSPGPHEFD